MKALHLLSILVTLFCALTSSAQIWHVDNLKDISLELLPVRYKNSVVVTNNSIRFIPNLGIERRDIIFSYHSTKGVDSIQQWSAGNIDPLYSDSFNLELVSQPVWVSDTMLFLAAIHKPFDPIYLVVKSFKGQIVETSKLPIIPYRKVVLKADGGRCCLFALSDGYVQMYRYFNGQFFFNTKLNPDFELDDIQINWKNNLLLTLRRQVSLTENTYTIKVFDFTGYKIWEREYYSDSTKLMVAHPVFVGADNIAVYYEDPVFFRYKNSRFRFGYETPNFRSKKKVELIDAFSGSLTNSTNLNSEYSHLRWSGVPEHHYNLYLTGTDSGLLIGNRPFSNDLLSSGIDLLWLDMNLNIIDYKDFRFSRLFEHSKHAFIINLEYDSSYHVLVNFIKVNESHGNTTTYNGFIVVDRTPCDVDTCRDGTCFSTNSLNERYYPFGNGSWCESTRCDDLHSGIRLFSPNEQRIVIDENDESFSKLNIQLLGTRDSKIYWEGSLASLFKQISVSNSRITFSNLELSLCLPQMQQCYQLRIQNGESTSMKFRIGLYLETETLRYSSVEIDFPLKDSFELFIRGNQFTPHCSDQKLLATTIYPNPSTDAFYIDHPGYGIKSEYEIYTCTGNKIHSGSFLNYTPSRIDVARFRAGLYFMVMKDEAGNVTTKRFVKL